MFDPTKKCAICDDDGWYPHAEFTDDAKKVIRIVKVRCPKGCPVKDNEPGVLPTALPQ